MNWQEMLQIYNKTSSFVNSIETLQKCMSYSMPGIEDDKNFQELANSTDQQHDTLVRQIQKLSYQLIIEYLQPSSFKVIELPQELNWQIDEENVKLIHHPIMGNCAILARTINSKNISWTRGVNTGTETIPFARACACYINSQFSQQEMEIWETFVESHEIKTVFVTDGKLMQKHQEKISHLNIDPSQMPTWYIDF